MRTMLAANALVGDVSIVLLGIRRVNLHQGHAKQHANHQTLA